MIHKIRETQIKATAEECLDFPLFSPKNRADAATSLYYSEDIVPTILTTKPDNIDVQGDLESKEEKSIAELLEASSTPKKKKPKKSSKSKKLSKSKSSPKSPTTPTSPTATLEELNYQSQEMNTHDENTEEDDDNDTEEETTEETGQDTGQESPENQESPEINKETN